jgi:hypothetical protein
MSNDAGYYNSWKNGFVPAQSGASKRWAGTKLHKIQKTFFYVISALRVRSEITLDIYEAP